MSIQEALNQIKVSNPEAYKELEALINRPNLLGKLISYLISNKDRIRSNIESRIDGIAVNLINDLSLAETLDLVERKLEKAGYVEESIIIKKIKLGVK